MNTLWLNKKILVTGGTGFIGKHLCERLVANGSEVVVLANRIDTEKSFSPSAESDRRRFVVGDIGDSEFIVDFFKKEKFNFCFHLAAQALVNEGDKSPVGTFKANIMGTVNVLDAGRRGAIDGIVLASTSHVYGENALPFLEEYFPRSSRPYETSKACADMIAQTYATHYNLPIAIARFVNVYGEGDVNPRIIPRTISKILANERPEILNPNVVRDYLHVDDAVNAYVMLAEKMHADEKNIVYNFGSDERISNERLVKKILTMMNREDLFPIIIDNGRAREIVEQYVSVEKAKNILQWTPRVSLDQGLARTIIWHKRNL